MVLRNLADGRELFVAATAGADVARVDPILIESPCAGGISREEQVAVVVKVSDKRGGDARVQHAPLDLWNRLGRFRQIHGDPTISEPASASSMHCCAVAAASAVSVIVIDWTTTGAPPPTWTGPTRTPTVRWSLTTVMDTSMITGAAGRLR